MPKAAHRRSANGEAIERHGKAVQRHADPQLAAPALRLRLLAASAALLAAPMRFSDRL